MARPQNISGFRSSAERFWLSAIRQYTFNTPIPRGKYRLMQFALGLCRNLPISVDVVTTDGRRLALDIDNAMNEIIYFIGEYEKPVTEIALSLVRPGDFCLDVGANFGWYTTLFGANCGSDGLVHSFEPVPSTFRELQKNVSLLPSPTNVFVNNLALGDHEGKVSIDLGEHQASGFASISTDSSNGNSGITCRMTTLDSYLAENAAGRDVNVVKVDIEGAELMFLQGAGGLFKQTVPPILLIEMALAQTRDFGYTPDALIKKIDEMASYDHYAVNDTDGSVRRINGFPPDDIGANVFSIPRGHYGDRTAELLKRIKN